MEIRDARRRRIHSVGEWRAASKRPAAEWGPYGPAGALAKWVLDDGLASVLPDFIGESALVDAPLWPSRRPGRAAGQPHHLLVTGRYAEGRLLVAIDARSDAPFLLTTVGERLIEEDGIDGGLEPLVVRLYSAPAEVGGELTAELVELAVSVVHQAAHVGVDQAALLLFAHRDAYTRADGFAHNAVVFDKLVSHFAAHQPAQANGPFANRLGPPLKLLRVAP